jgi:hypothetical protein
MMAGPTEQVFLCSRARLRDRLISLRACVGPRRANGCACSPCRLEHPPPHTTKLVPGKNEAIFPRARRKQTITPYRASFRPAPAAGKEHAMPTFKLVDEHGVWMTR